MKVFAINETEWIAAETQEEALEFEGYDPDELEPCTKREREDKKSVIFKKVR